MSKKNATKGVVPNESAVELTNVPLSDGIFNSAKREKVPKFKSTSAENVISKSNSWIVLGRDRPSDIYSGYGGKSETRSHAIDICVGRMGYDPTPFLASDNNFGSTSIPTQPGDAARIYISEKADIDKYFQLPFPHSTFDESQTVTPPDGLSAIAIKADELRLIARRSLRIFTHAAPNAVMSKNNPIDRQMGVEIIAGNKMGSDLSGTPYVQPMVKGLYLKSAMEELLSEITKINVYLTDFLLLQMKFNSSIMSGFDQGFAGPVPVLTFRDGNTIATGIETQLRTFSDVIKELSLQRAINLTAIELNYVNENGIRSFLSKYNKVN